MMDDVVPKVPICEQAKSVAPERSVLQIVCNARTKKPCKISKTADESAVQGVPGSWSSAPTGSWSTRPATTIPNGHWSC